MDPSRSSLNLLSAIATSTDLNADGLSSTLTQPPPQIQSPSTHSHVTGFSSSKGLPPAPRDDYDDPDELPDDHRHHHASRASKRPSRRSPSYLRRRSPSIHEHEQFDYQPRTTYMTTSDTRSDSRASARSGSPQYPPVPPRRSSSRASSHIRDRPTYDESDMMPQSLHPSLKLVTGDSRHSATGTTSPSTFSSTNTNSGQHYHFPGAAATTGHYSSQQAQHDPRRMRSSSSLNRPHPYLSTNFPSLSSTSTSRPSSSRPSPAQSRPSPRFSPGYTRRPPSRFSDASSFEGEDGEGEEGSVHSDYYTGPVGMADSSMGGFGNGANLGRQNSIRSDTSTSSSYGNGRRGSESRQGYYDSPTASTSPNFMFVQHSSSSHGGPSGRDGSYPPPGVVAAAGDMSVGPSSSSSSQPTAPPLSLDSLPSYPPDQKPPFSYPVLIRLAIQGSPQKRLLLSQIYAAIEEKFPWYRDSAPKAWKASVRHCLSLNKEFVRMQRAVEDPGVGCGGWWSVGEGMKGLKRPRKRRAPQSKRSDNERMDDGGMNSGSEMPDNYDLVRRRHSVASTSGGLEVPYSAFSTPPMLHSSSLSPASMLPPPVSQSHGLMGRTGASQANYADDFSSLRLPPLHLPNQQPSASLALPTPPSSSRTLTFGTKSTSNEFTGERSYRTHSHTPTPSSSSLSSTQSQASSTSQTSSSNLNYGQPAIGKNRGNPMSISSLLNEGMKLEDKALSKEDTSMDIDNGVATKTEDSHVTMGDFTPFSSEQTIRRLSPPPALPVSHTKEMRKSSVSRPTSSREVKEEWSSSGRNSSENSRNKTPSAPSSSSRRAIDVKRTSERTTRDKSAKAWQTNMDLSNMDVESESE